MSLSVEQRAIRDSRIFLITQSAKNGNSFSQNEYNKLLNLKVNRTNKFTIQDLFKRYWNNFTESCKRQKKPIRPAIIENVEKLIGCKDFANGYTFYECSSCDNISVVPFTCKSRFCSSCGNKYREDRTREISRVCLKKPHRQFVFSIAEELREYFRKYRNLYHILFKSVDDAFNYLLTSKSKIAKKEKRSFGYVSFLHTFGRDIKDNPHIHVLICEAYMDKNNRIHKYDYFNYETLRKGFMKCLLDNIYFYLKKYHRHECHRFYKLKCDLYRKYRDGFYAHGPKLKQNTRISIKCVTEYIARYVSHPAIAESRITNVDYVNNTITYYYDPHEDDHIEDENNKVGRQYVTESVYTFIGKLIRHIPDKGFHLVRYCGFYSNRTTKNTTNIESLYTSNAIKKRKSNNLWRNKIKLTYQYDPLLCSCGTLMRLNKDLSYIPNKGVT